jgi:tetratricopeptide (TPR) repeat protein
MPLARNSVGQMTTRRATAAIVASVSFSLSGVALIFGITDLASSSANMWMRSWETQGYVSNLAQWSAAYSRISLARRLNPLSADHSADLGRLMDWQSLQQSSEGALSMLYRERASRFYREAIEKRPSWGYAWANYAQSQLLLGNREEEVLPALEKAIVLAPWEPQVQRKVAWIGIASWDRLPGRLRAMFEESIRRTVETDSSLVYIARLAIQFNWVDHLIPLLRTERQQALLEYVLQQAKHR